MSRSSVYMGINLIEDPSLCLISLEYFDGSFRCLLWSLLSWGFAPLSIIVFNTSHSICMSFLSILVLTSVRGRHLCIIILNTLSCHPFACVGFNWRVRCHPWCLLLSKTIWGFFSLATLALAILLRRSLKIVKTNVMV